MNQKMKLAIIYHPHKSFNKVHIYSGKLAASIIKQSMKYQHKNKSFKPSHGKATIILVKK